VSAVRVKNPSSGRVPQAGGVQRNKRANSPVTNFNISTVTNLTFSRLKSLKALLILKNRLLKELLKTLRGIS
jgi:hypothetical protein